jgi:hypothetical protein
VHSRPGVHDDASGECENEEHINWTKNSWKPIRKDCWGDPADDGHAVHEVENREGSLRVDVDDVGGILINLYRSARCVWKVR